MAVVYKQVDLAGNTVYTDRLEVPPSEPKDSAADSKPQDRPARAAPSRRHSLVNASEAQRRLAQAQLKRKQGKAPLPGERAQETGELTYAYWRRQEKLRIEVEQAQRRANAVQQPLLAGASKM